MNTSRTNLAEIEYYETGSGDPVLFVHGALIADLFRPLMVDSRLTDHARLINHFRRGYSGSGRPTGAYGFNDQTSDCRSVLHELGIDRAHIVGHSLGGAIALELARESPEVVHSLSLLEPPLMIGASADVYRASLRQVAEQFHEFGAEKAVDAFLNARAPGYQEKLDRLVPGGFDQAVSDAAVFFDHEIPALLDWKFDDSDARQIRQPILSILGGRSQTLSPRFVEVHEFLVREIPNAEGHIVEGTGHFMQLENPADTAIALANFWTRHPIAGRSTTS